VITGKIFGLITLTTVALALVSCAEDEQNRVLSYEKGTYLGNADQSLTPEQLRQLVIRSQMQRVY
jgi:hypothetical protein